MHRQEGPAAAVAWPPAALNFVWSIHIAGGLVLRHIIDWVRFADPDCPVHPVAFEHNEPADWTDERETYQKTQTPASSAPAEQRPPVKSITPVVERDDDAMSSSSSNSTADSSRMTMETDTPWPPRPPSPSPPAAGGIRPFRHT